MIDPIKFLELESLNQEQKDKIFPKLLADMAAWMIDSSFEELPKEKRDQFVEQLETVKNDPIKIVEFIERNDPDFKNKMPKYLEVYRQNFKLQKFIECL